MVIDITKCNGCHNCFLACRDEHCGNDFPPYAASQPNMGHFWMRIIEEERGKYPKVKADFIAVPCMHCEKAPCVEAAEDNAVYRRPDGIVIIDPEKAKGQKDIVKSCPYRVIYWNEEKVVYIALPKKFIAGTVVFGDTDECGKDAVVTLSSDGQKKAAKADIFGDF